MRGKGIYQNGGKRVLDLFCAGLGLLLLWPVFLILSAVVYLDDPGPVFFSQKRFGKDKRFFMLHKFRSMKCSTPHDIPTHLLENPEQYLTGVGSFLRKSSLDELPQLWDILLGKMSLVGPRPALWNQEDLIAERDRCGANALRPGLTGWAQINGRDELSIKEKARFDGEYARRLSFAFDLRCLIGTVRAVVSHKGYIEGADADRRGNAE